MILKLTEFSWDKSIADISKSRVGNQAVALFLANEAKRLMNPYVPAQHMDLSKNIRVYTENNNGKMIGVVEYMSPYAHYQFIGKLYVDPKTGTACFTNGEDLLWSRPGVSKVPSKRKLEYSTFRHPLATSRWDKAMLVARKSELQDSLEKYINK